MGAGMMDGLGELIIVLMVICAISVPLGVWKLVDLVMWAAHHVSIH